MMNREKEILLEKTHRAFFDTMLMEVSSIELADIVVQDVMGYGTTIDEKVFAIDGLKELVKIGKEQSAGRQFTCTTYPVHKRILPDESTAIMVDEVALSMQLDEGKNEFIVRISTVFNYIDDSWKVVHWHGSKPVEIEGDTWHQEEWKQLNEKLQKQVDKKTAELKNKNHELEIEAALERVRAVAMGMQKSDDILDVCKVISEQLEKLNISHIRNTQVAIVKESNKTYLNYQYFTPYAKKVFEETEYENYPTSMEMVVELQKSANSFFTGSMKGKELDKFRNWRKKYNQFPDPKLDDCPEIFYYFYSIGQGGLGLTTYQKISKDDLDIFKRFHKVFRLAYQRYTEIEKAKAQAREAQIEAALERVRSQSMGMQSSEDLSKVTSVMFDQLRMLGGELFAAGIVLCDKHEGHVEQWHSIPNAGMMTPFIVPIDLDKVHQYRYDQWKKGTQLFSIEIEEDFIEQHFKTLFDLPSVKIVLKDFEERGTPMPGPPPWEIDYGASFKYGYLLVSALKPFEDKHILPRFAKVFEQTFTRFLDLQKAEAQAREAQIEVALERVRSRTMGMQKSEELKEVIQIIFEQFALLNINAEHAGIVVDFEEKKDFHFWVADSQDIPSKITVPYLDLVWDKQFTEAKKKGKAFFTTRLNFEEKNSFYKALLPHIQGLAKKAQDFYFSCPGLAASTVIEQDIGLYIENFSGTPYSNEENAILMRFGKSFQQTYTRFLDLKKAEAQAKEALIEAALERVRSRTMAMQGSDELREVVRLIYNQLDALNFVARACNIIIMDKQSGDMQYWVSGFTQDIYPESYHVPKLDHPYLNAQFDAWKKADNYALFEYSGEEKISFDKLFFTQTEFKNVPDRAKRDMKSLKMVKLSTAYFKYGALQVLGPEPLTDENIKTLQRLAKVFEQTYTRFLDLKKAEEQTRKAQIETALERVRARAMAMQEPEELKEVAEVMRNEMGLLGVEELETSSIYITGKKQNEAECWFALKGLGKSKKKLVSDHFELDYKDTWVGREMLKFYKSSKKQVSIVMSGEPRIEWIRYCEKKSVPFRGYYGDVIPDRTYHLYKFSHGAIGAATAGDFSEENWGLLRKAASVFSLAYARFNDLTKARLDLIQLKEEKKRAEKALSELRSTQTQLIHAEKMASLGELTAGIAHEIQNPLNFVNNFSEVNAELITELLEEIARGDLEEVKAIAKDIGGNEEKIIHHGRRAEAIVKGMLQHSRGSSKDKHETDLNALADEYLRLSYHGLRAKDKSFNADFVMNADKNLPKVNVIAQDIGRVLLNLINNAFYAVSEKAKQNEQGYKPTVTVTTKVKNRNIEIHVRDNGSGIPESIKDKIFQPFFTTKPTGQGTGLGLSMSYDIITKGHNGEIKVNSTAGKGTEFIVILPSR